MFLGRLRRGGVFPRSFHGDLLLLLFNRGCLHIQLFIVVVVVVTPAVAATHFALVLLPPALPSSRLMSTLLLAVATLSSTGSTRALEVGRRGLVGLAAASTQQQVATTSLTLNDGCRFPVVSFGLQIYDNERARRYTLTALEAGYRNFFASVLAGNQQGFGRAVRESGIDRSEIFVCGSVLSQRANGFDEARRLTRRGCDENLAALGLVPDQIMLDYPAKDADSIRGQWRALEDMRSRGQVASLAVSNFSPAQLDVIKDAFATAPAVNQLRLGVGYKPGLTRRLLRDHESRGVLVQAWSPLRSVGPRSSTLCAEIGRKYAKSPQQVALKWILRQGATFTTQSTRKDHFLENIDLFDFDLTEDEVRQLSLVES